jgi:hypothetical protein
MLAIIVKKHNNCLLISSIFVCFKVWLVSLAVNFICQVQVDAGCLWWVICYLVFVQEC